LFSPKRDESVEPTPAEDQPDSVGKDEVRRALENNPVEKDVLDIDECDSEYNVSKFIPNEESKIEN